MKKLVSALLSGIMALSAIPMLAAAESLPDEMTAEQFAACDFNEDGYIDNIDCQFILEYYAGWASGQVDNLSDRYITEQVKANIAANGDLDGDGRITAIDAAFLLKYMVENTNCKVEHFTLDHFLLIMGDEAKLGDMNGDGYVDSVDASNILAYYARMSTDNPIDTAEMLVARYKGDINGDGSVDAIDASLVLNIYMENSTD